MRVVQMSLLASWGIVLVFVLRFFLKRISYTYAYLLWGIILFRLVCPVVWEAPIGLLPSWEGMQNLSATQEIQEADLSGKDQPETDISGGSQPETEIPGRSQPKRGQNFGERQTGRSLAEGSLKRADAENTENPGDASVQEKKTKADLGILGSAFRAGKIAGIVWALGVACFWGAGLVSYLRFWGKLGDAVFWPSEYEEKGDKTDPDVAPTVLLCRLDTPFVMGILKPRIYLPAHLEREERAYILLHEQTHIRRGDHLVKLLGFLLLGVHWFNPLVYIAFYFLERDMEMSCDEQVLLRLGSQIKREYSASLLKLSKGGRVSPGIPLAFGERDVKERIRHVLRFNKPSHIAGGAGVLVALLAGTGLLLCPAKPARPSLTQVSSGIFTVHQKNQDKTVSLEKGIGENPRNYVQDLRPVGAILDGLFQELMEGAPASSNPMDYVEARPEAFARILGYRYSTLAYCYTAFELGGQTGLKGHLMAEACRQITDGKTGENTGSPSYAEGWQDGAGETYGNGQEWYDARKALAEKMEAKQGWDEVVKYRLLEGSILQFLDGDMEGYMEEIFLPDYVYQGGDETEKLVYGSLRQMAEKEEPGYYDGFSVWAVRIHGTYDEGRRRKVMATVYEGKYHLYGNKIKEEGGSVIPMALTYERRTETGGAEETGVEGETKEGAYRLVSCERAGDGSYFLPSVRAFCTMPVSGEPIDGLAEAIVSTYGQDKDVAGPYGQDKGLDGIMEEHVMRHLEKWGVSRELP